MAQPHFAQKKHEACDQREHRQHAKMGTTIASQINDATTSDNKAHNNGDSNACRGEQDGPR